MRWRIESKIMENKSNYSKVRQNENESERERDKKQQPPQQ